MLPSRVRRRRRARGARCHRADRRVRVPIDRGGLPAYDAGQPGGHDRRPGGCQCALWHRAPGGPWGGAVSACGRLRYGDPGLDPPSAARSSECRLPPRESESPMMAAADAASKPPDFVRNDLRRANQKPAANGPHGRGHGHCYGDVHRDAVGAGPAIRWGVFGEGRSRWPSFSFRGRQQALPLNERRPPAEPDRTAWATSCIGSACSKYRVIRSGRSRLRGSTDASKSGRASGRGGPPDHQ